MKVFNVWTLNSGGTVSCMFSGTRAACRRMILGRWGHWPPFAIISTITSESNFKRKYAP